MQKAGFLMTRHISLMYDSNIFSPSKSIREKLRPQGQPKVIVFCYISGVKVIYYIQSSEVQENIVDI